jgi:hypothetical protein
VCTKFDIYAFVLFSAYSLDLLSEVEFIYI